MSNRRSSLTPDYGVHAKYCIERRGKRRLVKTLLRQRMKTRRFWAYLIATSAAAGALVTLALLTQYGAHA
jgi:hypothetical protein